MSIAPLSKERERELIALAKAGDRAARSTLLTQFHWMLWRFATNVRTQTEMADDLYQEAAIAFLKSLDRFDLQRNVRLTTYLYRRIPFILQQIADEGGLIRVPKNHQNRWSFLTRDRANRAKRINSIYCEEEIDELAMPAEEVDPFSEERELLKREIKRLPKKQRIVIRERIAGKTLRTICGKLRHSREFIRKIEMLAIDTLKQRLAAA